MKCVFFFFIFYSNLSVAFGYQFNSSAKFKGSDLYEISVELQKVQLIEFDLTRVGNVQPFLFDQIYLDADDSNNFAVVVMDLFAPDRILKLSGRQLVCHAETKSGRAFAVYFSDEKLASGVSYCQSKSSRNAVIRLLLPQAHADVCDSEMALHKKVTALRNNVLEQKELFIQKMGTCMSQSLQGAIAALPDGTLISKLLLKPEDLWSQISTQAKAYKDLILNISHEAKALVKEFGNLDGELVMNLICQKGAEVLVDSLIFGGGVALIPKVSLAVVKLTSGLKELRNVFSKLIELKKSGRIDLANGILSCGT